jgi:hypothetical protein
MYAYVDTMIDNKSKKTKPNTVLPASVITQCFSFAFLLLSIVFHNFSIDFPIYFASKG